MPDFTLIRPFINPMQFYKETPDSSSRYLTKDFEDWYFSDTILPWEQRVSWHQPWQKSDTIKDQLHTNNGPVTLLMYDEDDNLIDTIPYNQVMPNFNDPTLFIWQVDVDLSGYDEGCYYFKITFGSPVNLTLRSENIILSDNIENTILLEFSQSTYREDMIFETGIQPTIRIPAVKKFKGPASKNTLYEDQVLNMSMLRSINYRVWTLSIGGGKGIPDYMADKIDRMLGCKTVLLDNKYYIKTEGSLEPSEEDSYPLRGWTIDMREKTNRASRHFENTTAVNTVVSVMVNVDSKGFGADTGGNETVITDVE